MLESECPKKESIRESDEYDLSPGGVWCADVRALPFLLFLRSCAFQKVTTRKHTVNITPFPHLHTPATSPPPSPSWLTALSPHHNSPLLLPRTRKTQQLLHKRQRRKHHHPHTTFLTARPRTQSHPQCRCHRHRRRPRSISKPHRHRHHRRLPDFSGGCSARPTPLLRPRPVDAIE
jgi:hypothetical protein